MALGKKKTDSLHKFTVSIYYEHPTHICLICNLLSTWILWPSVLLNWEYYSYFASGICCSSCLKHFSFLSPLPPHPNLGSSSRASFQYHPDYILKKSSWYFFGPSVSLACEIHHSNEGHMGRRDLGWEKTNIKHYIWIKNKRKNGKKMKGNKLVDSTWQVIWCCLLKWLKWVER